MKDWILIVVIGLGWVAVLLVLDLLKRKEVLSSKIFSQAKEGLAKGEKLEGIAFNFCKAATLMLIFQKYALLVVSGLAAVFFIWGYLVGKEDTRCLLKKPLLIAGFWGTVSVYLCIKSFF